ncbi:hypothetical protein C7N43_06135 [Sphingobacteriales bacterium UPWRP_1]|nr:hypothetical protein BVG80_11815 [Sphingobacteriales bacterium TSM_CSM]PSJ77912.1 hypothetical protein C7N43_06135 [Sphingobacteriales bacterium UPWRP_1]
MNLPYLPLKFFLHTLFATLWVLFFTTGCNTSTPKTYGQVTRSFYFWKTVFALSAEQRNTLQQLNVERLYIKLFDVDWSATRQAAVPIAPVRFEEPLPKATDIVPVVYITNKTFVNLPDTLVAALADSVYHKMQTLLAASGTKKPSEIQFDCDWTSATAGKFFAFIRAFKLKLQPAQTLVSATIRLHQVKYRSQTGIPPADRGVLMFYNMGNFKDPNTNNSVLDLKEAKRYLQTLNQYPLPLDVALPLFSWGVVFRNGQFANLINQLTTQTANNLPQLLQPLGKGRYRALQSGIINGSRVGKDDVVRVEEVPLPDALKAASWLSKNIGTTNNLHVALYHLYPNVFENYPTPAIESIFNTF